MITVHQPKVLSRNLILYDGDSPVGEIRFQYLGTGAEIVVGSTMYEGVRRGWFKNAYEISRGSAVVATAEPIGFWQRSYEVRTGNATFTLRRQKGWFKIGWNLFDGDSQVGTMTRTGVFRTKTEGTFDDSIDTATQIFVIWIANAIWQQDQAAAAAAG